MEEINLNKKIKDSPDQAAELTLSLLNDLFSREKIFGK